MENIFGKYGVVSKDEKGLIICHICGKSFSKLGAHSWQKHKITASDYRKMFGLCSNTKLCSDELYKVMKNNWESNIDIQTQNLLKGKGKRFVPGDERVISKRKVNKQRYLQLCDSAKIMREKRNF